MSRKSGRITLFVLVAAIILCAVAVFGTTPGPEIVKVAPSGVTAKGEGLETGSAWTLFDGDTETAFAPSASARVTVTLPSVIDVTSINIYGASSYGLKIYKKVDGQWEPLKGLGNMTLSNAGETWNSYELKPFSAGQLQLEFIPEGKAAEVAGVREVEIWGDVTDILGGGKALLSLAGLAKGSEVLGILEDASIHVVEFASTEEISVVNNIKEDNPPHVVINIESSPVSFGRAYLLFDSETVLRPIDVRRQINGLGWSRGYNVVRPAGEHKAWVTHAEEINPAWLKAGENRIDFRSLNGLSKIRNVRIVAETGSGWNALEAVSDAELFDGDLSTGYQVPAELEAPYVEMRFERRVEVTGMRFNVPGPMNLNAKLQYLNDEDEWEDLLSGWNINLTPMVAGWNDVELDALGAGRNVRLVFDTSSLKGDESKAAEAIINEIQVRTSPVGSLSDEPRVVVSYPRDGEFFGRTAYVQGFVTPASGASVTGEGKEAEMPGSGAFGMEISKDETRFKDQENGEPWDLVVSSGYKDGSAGASETVQLYRDAYRNGKYYRASKSAIEVEKRDKHSEKVAPGQAKKIVYGDLVIDIPQGAVDEETEITIIPLTDEELAELDPGMVNVTYPAAGYRFLPHGMKFKKPIHINFGYAPELLLTGQDDDEANMYFYHEKAGKWMQLKKVRVDRKGHQVVAETDHFTDMINATLVVPEHPEALSYNPNTIKDIKAADPGAEINQIQPPQANNKGDANLSYPIQVPPGRKGMQPQLAVQYSSSGGNGWMGLGWNIPMRAVTIDTRWGVPRYSDTLETETYMLEGAMLSPVAHRSAFGPRSTGDKEFHPRVEGQFQKIMRRGSSPSSYWWEVTDKDGVIYRYGDNSESRLKNPSGGNIFTWALHQVEDPNGNTIDYHYSTSTALNGTQFYLQSITYTGHGGEEGRYTVEFIRDSELGESLRTDKSVDARAGFKVVTAERLRQIKVWYTTELVRRYDFEYEEGSFHKTLLTDIVQLGADKKEFNRHTFTYHDEIRNDNDSYKGFMSAVPTTTPSDKVLPLSVPSALDPSMLNGSYGYTYGGHFYFGIWLYTSGKKSSVGVKTGFSKSQHQGYLSLVDINGDGLPDKVFRDAGGPFKYRAGKLDRENNYRLVFDNGKKSVNNLPTLSSDESESTTFSTDAFIYVASFSKSDTTTLTRGNSYLSDANGDGLIDLVHNGRVKFNHMEGETPVFEGNSANTPSPLGSTGELLTEDLIDDDYFASLEDERRKQSPLIDAVRIWEAPYDGTLSIAGSVALVNSCSSEYETEDGVRVAIQVNGEEKWDERIESIDSAGFVTREHNLTGIPITRGDKVYFHVNSVDDGACDEVSWNPVIAYTSVSDTERTDVNNLPVYHYTSADEFTLAGRNGGVRMPYQGEVKILGEFRKTGVTTDDVTVTILKSGEEIYSHTLSRESANETVQIDLPATINVIDTLTASDSGQSGNEVEEVMDDLEFLVRVDSPIDITRVEWTPRVYYLSATQTATDMSAYDRPIGEIYNSPDNPPENYVPTYITKDVPVKDKEGNYILWLYPHYDIDIYSIDHLTAPQDPWVAPKDGSVIAVPRLSFAFDEPADCSIFAGNDWRTRKKREKCEDNNEALEAAKNDTVVFTVKLKGEEHGELLDKIHIQLVNGSAPHPYESAILLPDIEKNDEIFYDFSVRNPDLKYAFINGSSVTYAYIGNKAMRAPFDGTINVKSELKLSLPYEDYDTAEEDREHLYGEFMVALVKNDEIYLRRIAKITNTVLSGEYNFHENIEVEEGDMFFFEILTPDQWVTTGGSFMNYGLYNKEADALLYKAEQWHPADDTKNGTPVKFVPNLSFIEGSDSLGGGISFRVLRNGSIVNTTSVSIAGGEVGDPESFVIETTASKSDKFELQYLTENFHITNAIDLAGGDITYGAIVNTTTGEIAYEDTFETHDATVLLYDSKVFNTHLEETAESARHHAALDGLFAEPYRNWMNISYNGNECVVSQDEETGEWTSEGCAIDEDELTNAANGGEYADYVNNYSRETHEDSSLNDETAYAVSPVIIKKTIEDLQNDVDVDENDSSADCDSEVSDCASEANVTRVDYWAGQDENLWIARNGMSSSRLGIDNVTLPRSADFAVSVSGGGGSAVAVPRMSMSNSDSWSAGAIVSGSTGSGSSTSLMDYMDMNGDRYPDILGGGGIQYTYPTGGLSPQRGGSFIRSSSNESINIGFGGNPANIIGSDKGTTKGTEKGGENGSAMPTISIGYGEGTADVQYDLRDVNGDGLPDKVIRGGAAYLNLGYGFDTSPYAWGFSDVDHSENTVINGGAGFNKGAYGFAGGLNIAKNKTNSKSTLMDINGDGLPDKVWYDNGLWVKFNTGSGFGSPYLWWTPHSALSQSDSITAGGGVYVNITVKITLTFIVICLEFNPGGNFDMNTQRMEIAIRDVNGDGFPDQVLSENNNSMSVGLSPIGKTNMLHTVTRPLGSVMTLDYERNGNTYEMPQNHWDMVEVTIDDNNPYADDSVTLYEYRDGYHDRHEREFYGYKTVLTKQTLPAGNGERAVYRTIEQEYLNGNYYEKGLLARESLHEGDGDGPKYTDTLNTYTLVDAETMQTPSDTFSSIFPRLDRTDKVFFEGQDSPFKYTATEFVEYDLYGNVTKLRDTGDDTTVDDDLYAEITYTPESYFEKDHIVNRPDSITVRASDENGDILRNRKGEYDAKGNMTKLTSFIGDGVSAVTELGYEPVYGNLASVTGPENYKGERYILTFAYDKEVNTHIVRIDDSYGYYSSSSHDYRFAKPLSTTDINGNLIEYRYDTFGRATQIYGPYDIGKTVPTIGFSYDHNARPAWAYTRNKEHWDTDETIDTVILVDGLGRAIQTKKEAEILIGETKQHGMTASGRVVFDAFGRTLYQGQPHFQAALNTTYYDPDMLNETRYEYDILNRTLKVSTPDHLPNGISKRAETETRFSISEGLFKTWVRDPKLKVKEMFKDSRNLIHEVREYLTEENNNTVTISTKYGYNPMSKITSVVDDRDNTTLMGYDLLGRRLFIDNPDMGKVEYAYDKAGNLIEKMTPNLRASGNVPVPIRYEYDHTRLVKIDYPESADVEYTYGTTPEHKVFSGLGRIIHVENGDMWEERYYGKLGETVKSVKSIRSDVPSRVWPVFTTEYEFDSFGRMRTLAYPDGEVLRYTYDRGGLLETATGYKDNGKGGIHEYPYLKDLSYDHFGQRVRMELGNGVLTEYEYYADNRRLSHIETIGTEGKLQDITYTYDLVGNILRTENTGFITRDPDLPKDVVQNYEYDDLHRLVWAGGEYKRDADSNDTYTNTFVYDTIGNMLNKDQQHTIVHTDGSVSPRPRTTYNLGYDYGSSRPHAATHIGGKTYEYDANGNLERWMDDQTKREMLFTWNEDNQLLRTEEQGKLTIYRYDDSGTRVIKRGKYGEVLYVNENYSLRNGEVGTKHVFAGNTRIATKITMKEQKLNASKATYDKSEGGHNGRMPEKSNGKRLGWGKKIDTGVPVHESQGNAYGHEKQAERGHEVPGQLKQLDKAIGSAENAKGKGKSKTKENANAKSQDKVHPHDYKYDTDLPGNSEKGLENALAHGKGHKYGIYKRLARRGLIVNSSGDIVPIGSDGDDVSGDDGDGDTSSGIPTVGNATGAVPDEFGIYYYHGDHLGSSNIITDRKGRNYEHVEYFPYGETWVDEQRNTTHLPYRFTGKELDPETGMYYFGARYYDPVTSRWMSADPILGKYLDGNYNGGIYNPAKLSVFSYVLNNPIRLMDPDGLAEKEGKPRVILSPGHGVMNPGPAGGSTVGGFNEVSYIYKLQKRLIPALESNGFEVVNLKALGAYSARAKIRLSNKLHGKKNAKIHLSLHADSRGKTGTEGVVVYYDATSESSKEIAEHFNDALKDAGFTSEIRPDTKSQHKRLGEVRDPDAPATLIEIGNIASESDRKRMEDPKYMQKMADTITKAIKEFKPPETE